MVAFTLASNALGSVTDAARIAAAAGRVGALAWADAVHLAPHRRLRRARARDRRAALLALQVLRPAPRGGSDRAHARRDASRGPRPAGGGVAARQVRDRTQSHEAIAGATAAMSICAHSATAISTRPSTAYATTRRRCRAASCRPRPASRGSTCTGSPIPTAWGSAHPPSASTWAVGAARARGSAGRARHLRLGRQLLRAGADAGAWARRTRRRARRLPPLHDGGRVDRLLRRSEGSA